MIKKVKSLIKKPNDLIELYCGSGTFTIPLSKQFKRIFATENNRKSIICLEKGIKKIILITFHTLEFLTMR